ncbi:hypothetical protein HNR77_004447 [Paenibacillus sp. JGP012]|nr:hypothetical protein [Paenibacillus sp. JGP012]
MYRPGSGTEGASCYAPGIAVNLSGKCTIVGRSSGECAEEAPPKGNMIGQLGKQVGTGTYLTLF